MIKRSRSALWLDYLKINRCKDIEIFHSSSLYIAVQHPFMKYVTGPLLLIKIQTRTRTRHATCITHQLSRNMLCGEPNSLVLIPILCLICLLPAQGVGQYKRDNTRRDCKTGENGFMDKNAEDGVDQFGTGTKAPDPRFRIDRSRALDHEAMQQQLLTQL